MMLMLFALFSAGRKYAVAFILDSAALLLYFLFFIVRLPFFAIQALLSYAIAATAIEGQVDPYIEEGAPEEIKTTKYEAKPVGLLPVYKDGNYRVYAEIVKNRLYKVHVRLFDRLKYERDYGQDGTTLTEGAKEFHYRAAVRSAKNKADIDAKDRRSNAFVNLEITESEKLIYADMGKVGGKSRLHEPTGIDAIIKP